MASSSSVFQPSRSAYRRYIRSRSPANSADSSPPSPALTSRITSRSSSGSRGMSSWRSVSSAAACGRARARAARRRSPRPRPQLRAASTSSGAAFQAWYAATSARARRTAAQLAPRRVGVVPCTAGSASWPRARRAPRRSSGRLEHARPCGVRCRWCAVRAATLRTKTQRRARDHRGSGPALGKLLARRVLLAVARLEPGHAATGVEDLLLARVERVAGAADVGVDLAAGARCCAS